MTKVLKRFDGKCPYCLSVNLTIISTRRPNQDMCECADCNKFCVKTPSGTAYPLEDPTDSSSAPYN